MNQDGLIVNRWILYFVSALRIASAQLAEVRGQAVDPTNAAVSRASVRLTVAGTALTSVTDVLGAFVIRDVQPGNYSLRILAPGFRAHVLYVKVNAGEVKELGAIHLELEGSCDAPGMMCDYVGEAPRIESQGFVTLKQDSAVDLDIQKVFQSDAGDSARRNRGADVILSRRSDVWEMTPINGASLSQTDCISAKFETTPLDLNELERGDEICVKTDRHKYAHVFIVDGIGAGGSTLRLWYVTH
jgi:hypothetical protein